ncbi:uncharacterized protein CPUR_07619 [Claviceps purpurea 20.1]|uniref:Uncharacterized protein n=1 Tax=Claviceps purpurea (strain 20.1) TaxID=1111077 RepID=M1WFI6_CLAP2|nr:hypothetical protein E4U12_003566 [Claviceps purpurea]CCE33693.1 uncharacterized protein CPUR_07619 [Claviceps purpurea 20.1]KAG6216937.1 hypothetical protein E4U50_004783 [Claviceps purpurea]KAG6225457.1 hypothetical protein E4U26_003042 [Claviceps purpurea]KAG6252229.1 hypothetical protein E4U24_000656 [Claviceps purpurea]
MASDLGLWLRDQTPVRFGACSIGMVCASSLTAGADSVREVAGTGASKRRAVVVNARRETSALRARLHRGLNCEAVMLYGSMIDNVVGWRSIAQMGAQGVEVEGDDLPQNRWIVGISYLRKPDKEVKSRTRPH